MQLIVLALVVQIYLHVVEAKLIKLKVLNGGIKMTTYREVANMVLDILKLISDDSIFQIEHVIFLMDKFRAVVLKQRYSDVKKEIPESNFQTICVDLKKVPAYVASFSSPSYE